MAIANKKDVDQLFLLSGGQDPFQVRVNKKVHTLNPNSKRFVKWMKAHLVQIGKEHKTNIDQLLAIWFARSPKNLNKTVTTITDESGLSWVVRIKMMHPTHGSYKTYPIQIVKANTPHQVQVGTQAIVQLNPQHVDFGAWIKLHQVQISSIPYKH